MSTLPARPPLTSPSPVPSSLPCFAQTTSTPQTTGARRRAATPPWHPTSPAMSLPEPLTTAGHQCRAPPAPKPPPSSPLVRFKRPETPPRRHGRRSSIGRRGAPSFALPRPEPPPETSPSPLTGAPRPLHHRPNPLERRRRGPDRRRPPAPRGAPPPPLLNPNRAHSSLPHPPPKPPSPDAPSLRRRRAAAAAQNQRRRPLPRRRRHRPSRPNPRPPIGARRRPLSFPLRAPTPGDPPRREKRRRALLCSKTRPGTSG